MSTPRQGTALGLIGDLLDKGYEEQARQVIDAIAAQYQTGVIRRRLGELEAEAARLAEAGQRLTLDNATVRVLLIDLERELRRSGARLDGLGPALQEAGAEAAGIATRQLTLPFLSDDLLAQIGVGWNVPDPEAVARLIDYANSVAWADEVAAYAGDGVEAVRAAVIRGIALGRNPRAVAAEIAQTVQGYPVARANTLARTLQLESYRQAGVAHRLANADILSHSIRVAALDRRTCLFCIAEHGTRMEIGEKLVDHHNGRCTVVNVVRGRTVTVQPGPEWFESLPEARQREQVSFARTPAKFRAFKDGAIGWGDFRQDYSDRVFGEMAREASLKGILGDGAQRYYVRGGDG